MYRLNRLFPYVVILLLSFWMIYPFFNSGFFPMHDDSQPSRVYLMYEALKSGQFPVRWVNFLGFGLGYPLYNFYAPFPYYIGSLVMFILPDPIIATKVMFAAALIISGIAMYILACHFAGKVVSIVCATLYMYAPYHAIQVFVRGSLGELYAYAFLPLLFLSIVLLLRREWGNNKPLVVGSMALAVILVSHNILGMISLFWLGLFFILLCLLVILRIYRPKIIVQLLLIILFGVGISAFFTVPAYLEKKYTQVNKLTKAGSDFHQHFVYLDQLWDWPWGYAGSAPGRADGMSYKIGKTHLLVGIASFFAFLYVCKKRRIKTYQMIIFLVSLLFFILSIFFMLEISTLVWEFIPLFPFIQYPWRFLSFAVLFISFLSIFLFNPFEKRIQLVLAGILIFIIIWFNAKYFQPQEYISVSQYDYTAISFLRQKYSLVSYEYMPKDFTPSITTDMGQFFIPASILEKISDIPTRKIYKVTTKRAVTGFIDIAYFPSWKAKINGENIILSHQNGIIVAQLPSGNYNLELFFEGTMIEKVSNAISIFSTFLLVYVSLFSGKSLVWRKKAQ